MNHQVAVAHQNERKALSLLAYSPEGLAAHPWTEEHFGFPAHQHLFRAIRDLAAAGRETDMVAVTCQLESQGNLEDAGGAHGVTDVLMTLPCAVPSEVPSCFTDLSRAMAFREWQKLVAKSAQDVSEMRADLGDLAGKLASIAKPADARPRRTLKDQLGALLDQLEGKAQRDFFPFGIPALDNRLGGGICNKELAVIAAPTSAGKSVMLGMAAIQAAQAGRPVLMFSLEMPAEDLLRRFLSNIASVGVPQNAHGMAKGAFDRIQRAIMQIEKLPLRIVDNVTDLAAIETEARLAAQARKLRLLVVDYLQLVSNPGQDTRELAMSETARRLKNLALETGLAVLTASQLNDDGRLRESRAIGHHADVVLTISDDGKISSSKFRRGARDWMVQARLRGELGRFEA
jgi:replicative DNA helicase